MLEAIRHAALALQYAEFARLHEHRLADKDSLPPLVQQQLEHGTQVRMIYCKLIVPRGQSPCPPNVLPLHAWARLPGGAHLCASQVGADENILGAARRVQSELTTALRALLKHGNILVLPTLPSPPLAAGYAQLPCLKLCSAKASRLTRRCMQRGRGDACHL